MYVYSYMWLSKITIFGFTWGRGGTGGGPLLKQAPLLAAHSLWGAVSELFCSIPLCVDECASDQGAAVSFRCKYTLNNTM